MPSTAWASRLFPEPLEPTTAVTRPGSAVRDRSRIPGSSTRDRPRPYRVKETDRPSAVKIGVIVSPFYPCALAGDSSSRARSPSRAKRATTDTRDSPGNRASHQRPRAR